MAIGTVPRPPDRRRPVPAIPWPGPTPAMRKAAQDFEGVFLARDTARGDPGARPPPGPLGNGQDDPFASMLQDEYAKLISPRSGKIGIADAVLREMLRAQAAS